MKARPLNTEVTEIFGLGLYILQKAWEQVE